MSLYGRANLWYRLFHELQTIHDEGVPLAVEGETAANIYAGDVQYVTPRGWRINIFNDCNEWDYINNAVSPEGVDYLVELDDTECAYLDGCFGGTIYSPDREEMVKVWGFDH